MSNKTFLKEKLYILVLLAALFSCFLIKRFSFPF